MSVEIILPIAAIVILLIILAWLFQIFKASIKTMLTIAAIFIVLQIAFDIDSRQLAQEILQMIARLKQIILN